MAKIPTESRLINHNLMGIPGHLCVPVLLRDRLAPLLPLRGALWQLCTWLLAACWAANRADHPRTRSRQFAIRIPTAIWLTISLLLLLPLLLLAIVVVIVVNANARHSDALARNPQPAIDREREREQREERLENALDSKWKNLKRAHSAEQTQKTKVGHALQQPTIKNKEEKNKNNKAITQQEQEPNRETTAMEITRQKQHKNLAFIVFPRDVPWLFPFSIILNIMLSGYFLISFWFRST